MKLIKKHIISLPAEDNQFIYVVRYMPWFTDRVMINVIHGDTQILHSHPWSYFTLMLWGGYRETFFKNGKLVVKNRYPGWFSYKKYSEYHQVKPIGKKSITFFIRGKEKIGYAKYLIDGKEVRDIKHWARLGCTRQQIDDSVVVE